MNQEDNLVRRIYSATSDDVRHQLIVAHMQENLLPLLKTSLWAYEEVTEIHLRMSREDFMNGFMEAWYAFFKNISDPELPYLSVPNTLCSSKKLYLTYHFPSYPRLAGPVTKSGIAIVIARQAEWMNRVFRPELLINFRDHQLKKLLSVFMRERSLVAMMDFAYSDTRSVFVPFLGKPCRTPIGLIQLARRYDYEMELISYDGFRIRTVPVIHQNDDTATLQILNELISEEIRANPANWMLWPSLDTRWEAAESVLQPHSMNCRPMI